MSNTLFIKIISSFILALAILSLLFMQGTSGDMIALVFISITIGFAFFLKHLFKPLHRLKELCYQNTTEDFSSFSCAASEEIVELGQAVKSLLQSHQHLCDQKQDIFKEAAHELKSPIAILKARLSLFSQKTNSDKELFVQEAQADIQSITLKLKELLFLKELEWDMQQIKQTFNIQGQCNMMRDVFSPILEKKNLSIMNTSNDDFTLHVHKEALGKVMQAIFENIFYHTKNHTTIETTINADKRSLQIKNIIGSKSDETLFSSSIGMKIIKRISDKLNYTYTTHEESGVYITTISFL